EQQVAGLGRHDAHDLTGLTHMKHTINLALMIVSLLVLAPGVASSQEGSADNCKDPKAADVVKCFSVDLSMPDSPGLMIVGLGSDNVVRPTTPRALGAALTNGIN